MAVFTIRDLKFTYPESVERAIDGLSLTVEKGEFLVICGSSGCGKSTLLRQLKTVIAPHGIRQGQILFEGQELDKTDNRTQSSRIGFVSQSPENQIVTDKVWHELAFGMESLGFPTAAVRGRVAEMAAFFGIENWFYKNVNELSGGQKQLLNLASVMTLQPTVLILDEPTGQLDPIAASEFLTTLKRINRELGTTVILTEHRLEEAFPLATRAAVMERGKIICEGTPSEVGAELKRLGSGMFLAMPAPMRIWAAVDSDMPCPITAAEGRSWLTEYAASHPLGAITEKEINAVSDDIVLTVKDVWFRYERDCPDVVRGLNLNVHKGELIAILGGNGAGKTTALKLISGIKKPYRGTVSANGTLAALPQSPQALFVKKTVREDLFEVFSGKKISKAEQESRAEYVTALCRLQGLLDRHPYDLSGGEQQRTALAKILLADPEILLLDEPTKGLDAEFKQEFAGILRSLTSRGVTVVMISHDIEFCARYAGRCALFFDGGIVTEDTPRAFFSGNSFYTTAANRMSRELLPQAVIAEDVIEACGGAEEHKNNAVKTAAPVTPTVQVKKEQPEKLPLWRKLIAAFSGLISLYIFLRAIGTADLSGLADYGGMTPTGEGQMKLYAVMILSLFICAFSAHRRSAAPVIVQTPKEKRRLSKRTVAAALMILLLIPFTLYIGVFYLESKHYYITALAVLLECMLPFFLVFESRKPKARELVTIASLCAIGVAGRAALFMLPQFKPVTALTVIAGIAFGGETGFLVGAVTMLVSNILFGQGPWTPFQMFAVGIIGFLAGILFRKGLLRRTRFSISMFGALCAILVYGGIMNPASALLWSGETLNAKIILTYCLTGFPMDLVHAASTALILWFGACPMLEKLDRIKVKYGLAE